MRRFSIVKLFLVLLAIGCLVVAGWVGYHLFILHSLDPVIGGVIFIVDIGVLIWNIVALRSHYYRGLYPSFKLVFLSLLGIVLILAFAGIEPLSGLKDGIIDEISPYIEQITNDDSRPKQPNANYELDIVVSNTGVMWIDADTPTVFFELDVGTNDRTVLGCVYLVSVNDGTGEVQRKVVLESHNERKYKSDFYISGQVALDIIERLTSDATKQYEAASDCYDNAKKKLAQHDAKDEEMLYDWWVGRSRAPSLDTINNRIDERKRLYSDVKQAESNLGVAQGNLQNTRVNVQVPSDVILPYIVVEKE